jgi:hypothetical protein
MIAPPFPILKTGETIMSPGKTFEYEVIGPVCRLYDREELPWPSCSIAWKGKQPSWRRIGRRFVVDMGTRFAPSYNVRCADGTQMVITRYNDRLSPVLRNWWITSIKAQEIVAALELAC